jgi:hypothetical protein
VENLWISNPDKPIYLLKKNSLRFVDYKISVFLLIAKLFKNSSLKIILKKHLKLIVLEDVTNLAAKQGRTVAGLIRHLLTQELQRMA